MAEQRLPDTMFELPQAIDDVDLRGLYEHVIHGLREDAAKQPTVTTLQELLIERIASNYIMLRFKERHNSFAHERNQREFYTYWLAMVRDYAQLAKMMGIDENAVKTEMTTKIVTAINGALVGLEPSVAQTVRTKLAEALETS
jgi:hypothetical protein